METEYTTDLEELATYGLDQIDENEKVQVNLKDLLYVYLTLQEYQQFFHQPAHYKSIKDVEAFLGSVNDSAGYKLLHSSIHEKMSRMLPEHIEEKFNQGVFESPKKPFYFESSETHNK